MDLGEMQGTCLETGRQFSISNLEQGIYRKLDVPVPKYCPEVRAMRRLAWRNERTLYRRKCDATDKSIISIFDAGTPFPVYSQEYWWSDRWDPLAYGREFDFSRPFFPQFAELFSKVPQCALRCPQSENSEYTNQCEKNKDCYMVFCSNGSRECLHGMWYQQCTDCVDCTYLEGSELCYQVLNGKICYRCTNCENIQNSDNCHFSKDLIGCSNCIGCVNLRNKRNCIFNEQLTEEDFLREALTLALHSNSGRTALSRRVEECAAKFPAKYYAGKNNEGFSGDYLENCKNTFDSYNCRNSENIFHCRDAWSGRNSIDLTETLDQDFCIEIEGCYKNVNCGFSAKISETHDAWYCSHCFSSRDLFGCVGLKQKRQCILNRQYSKDEYDSLRQKIIAHLKETGEWGQFFPMEYSPFAYNESVAFEYFPRTRSEVLRAGLRWKEPETFELPAAPANIPDSIDETSDEILNTVIHCRQSGRPFKLQRAELAFYRKMELPVPLLHPDIRHSQRMALRNPRKLEATVCSGCATSLQSTRSGAGGRRILCEQCYVAAVE